MPSLCPGALEVALWSRAVSQVSVVGFALRSELFPLVVNVPWRTKGALSSHHTGGEIKNSKKNQEGKCRNIGRDSHSTVMGVNEQTPYTGEMTSAATY